jgi:hypothetical protein
MAQQNRTDLYLYNWLRRSCLADDDNLFCRHVENKQYEKSDHGKLSLLDCLIHARFKPCPFFLLFFS